MRDRAPSRPREELRKQTNSVGINLYRESRQYFKTPINVEERHRCRGISRKERGRRRRTTENGVAKGTAFDCVWLDLFGRQNKTSFSREEVHTVSSTSTQTFLFRSKTFVDDQQRGSNLLNASRSRSGLARIVCTNVTRTIAP